MAGVRLLRRSDADLALEGVEAIARQAPTLRDIGPVLRRLGYSPIETTYLRRLPRTTIAGA
jgi:hypothetical protein